MLTSGQTKEVEVGGKIMNMEVYTMPKAAQALGKTLVTFRRWIKDGLLPPPVVTDTIYGYGHYTKGELKLVAKEIAEHEREFSYLHTTHVRTVEKLWQALEGYRRN